MFPEKKIRNCDGLSLYKIVLEFFKAKKQPTNFGYTEDSQELRYSDRE